MKKTLIILLAIVGIGLFVWAGFLSKPENHLLTRIETSSKVYWEAKYSEYSCESAIDMDGNMYMDCDTDYWSENISETHYLETEFSDLGFFYVKTYPEAPKKEGVFFPVIEPKKFNDYSTSYLDGIHLRKRIAVKCWYDLNEGSEDYSTIEFNEYDSFKAKIGTTVVIKTWYGIRLGV